MPLGHGFPTSFDMSCAVCSYTAQDEDSLASGVASHPLDDPRHLKGYGIIMYNITWYSPAQYSLARYGKALHSAGTIDKNDRV